jgi:hypothetical protein
LFSPRGGTDGGGYGSGSWWSRFPDHVAQLYRYRFKDGMPYFGNYYTPWDVVNKYRATFQFQRVPLDH